MRILIYDISKSATASYLFVNMALMLKERGHDVAIATTDFTPKSEEFVHSTREFSIRERGVEHIEINSVKIMDFLVIPQFSLLLKTFQEFDVIYFNNAFIPNEAFTILAKVLSGKPMISGFHIPLYEVGVPWRKVYRGISMRVFRPFINACHVLNYKDWYYLKKIGFKYIYFIPNAVDPIFFTSSRKKLEEDKFTVLFVGRLVYEKGADLLPEIIMRTIIKEPSIRFVICGAGPFKKQIIQLHKKYPNSVIYYGHVEHEKLPEIYSNASLLIAPSRREAFGLAIGEALAMGVPVIVSDKVYSFPYSLVMRSKLDPESFSNAVLKVYYMWKTKREDYDRISMMGRIYAIRNLRREIVAEKYDNMFREVLSLSQHR